MKHFRTMTALAGAFLFLGLSGLQAAPQPQDEDGWYHDRDTFFQGKDWHAHMFDRVREDLNRVQASDYHRKDQFHLDEARDVLGDLQTKLASRRYDTAEMDQVVRAIKRVLADNRLSPRNRNILVDDMTRLTDFQANHGAW